MLLVLFGAKEAGCLKKWLLFAVTIIDRYHRIK